LFIFGFCFGVGMLLLELYIFWFIFVKQTYKLNIIDY
ncbi:poly-beta-1,6-N-acetyl-D-glucosamine export protein, partial [Staphylococcus aureus]|nr:poly-beta-1,6-N-acetyl-D-glucosamine export protein [Staphylococcus aureus]